MIVYLYRAYKRDSILPLSKLTYVFRQLSQMICISFKISIRDVDTLLELFNLTLSLSLILCLLMQPLC